MECDYLEIKGNTQLIELFKSLFDELSISYEEKKPPRRMGMITSEQIITLLVGLVGGNGIAAIINTLKPDPIEMEMEVNKTVTDTVVKMKFKGQTKYLTSGGVAEFLEKVKSNSTYNER